MRVAGGEIIAVDLPGQSYASLRLVHPAGGVSERSDQVGVAKLTSEVLEDGIHGNSSLAPELEKHGAEWTSGVTWDSFVTGVDAPVGRLPDATSLFAEAVRTPALRPEDVQRRQEQLVERFWVDMSVPRTLAGRAVGPQLFTGRYATPLGGGPSGIQALTPEAVSQFHAAAIAGVAGTLIVVGDLSTIDVEAIGKAVFTGTSGSVQPRSVAPEPTPGPLPRVVVLDRPGAVQSALVLATQAPSRRDVDLPRAEGVSSVLGGMFGSRLNMELRERRGYTYGAHCRFDLRRDGGVLMANTEVDTPTTAESISVIFDEIERLRRDGVTEDELVAVRDSNTVGLPVQYSTSWAISSALVEMVVHDLPEDHVDRLRAGFEALTAEDLHTAAQELLRPDEAVVVVAGDAEALTDALTETGVGQVTVRQAETYWE
ncbi:pitrilysin family protein [Lipingzhangella sp. LS1_29]|uniref:Pitrilysin family protein n=1 Tax=Lipingzhangella rawalii TaxID=2055835 RepID=A0ABU2HBK5_9ACTN|nr:pitrilysin family protein [Lipingzhangella rawalii]MDS1271969.1 pitrilysin family protein [Lipingzhangella rawalii]